MKILWVAHAGWHIPQREHLFCRALSERHEVHVTDWVADFSAPRDYLSRRYARALIPGKYQDGPVTVHRIPRLSPALPFRTLRRLNTSIFLRSVQAIIRRHQIDVVVGTCVVPPPVAPRLIFDLFDDNVAFWRDGKRMRAYADEIEKVEQRYLHEADAVVAASSVLAEMARAAGTTRPIYHVPNGIDVASFEGIDREDARMLFGFSGTVVGSVGNHDSTVEVDKMLDAAQSLSGDGIQFVIAGRGSAIPYASARVDRDGIKNVSVRGYLAPDEARRMVVALDVGLCPYSKSAMDDARSPMRLLMYAAGGLPTVCTDLEEVRRTCLSNVVLVEDNASAFASGIRAALAIPRGCPPEIDNFELSLLVGIYERVLMNDFPEEP